MPDLTNITDFDPVTGLTTTTLVADHDRGTMDWAERQVGGLENIPMTPGGGSGGGPDPVDPTITSLAPANGVVGIEVTVVVTGTNFDAGSVVEVDQTAVPTTYTSATSLSATFTPATAGTSTFTVRHSNGEESNGSSFTVTTVQADPSQATVEQIQAYVDDHPELADEIRAAESARAGDARITLMTWLNGFIAHRDED